MKSIQIKLIEMRLRRYLVCLSIICSTLASAQINNTDTLTVIKLRKKNTTLSFYPDTNVLYRWQVNNVITIRSSNDTVPVTKVLGKNMEVKKIGKSTYQVFPFYSDTLNYQGGKLFVYTQNGKGKTQLNTVKEYKFLYPEMPVVTIAGVRSDSIISRKALVYGDLRATHKKKEVKVLAYTLEYTFNGKDYQVVELSNKFQLNTRNAFRKLNVGSVIKFLNVKVMMPTGYIETIPILTYYLEEDGVQN